MRGAVFQRELQYRVGLSQIGGFNYHGLPTDLHRHVDGTGRTLLCSHLLPVSLLDPLENWQDGRKDGQQTTQVRDAFGDGRVVVPQHGCKLLSGDAQFNEEAFYALLPGISRWERNISFLLECAHCFIPQRREQSRIRFAFLYNQLDCDYKLLRETRVLG